MATHYETLGVKPSASAAEIRKAYLRRARALHPDRQLDRNPADSRRAEQAMQQVNVAWNVLSDSKKKSEYDKRLAPVASRARAPQAARASTNRSATHTAPRRSGATSTTARPMDTEPAGRSIDEEPGDGSVSVWASLPVLIFIGLLLGILIVTAFAGNGPPDNRPIAPQVGPSLDIGECFELVGDQPRERSCVTGQADGVVVDIVPTPGNCPGSTTSIRDPGSELVLCWERLIPGSAITVAP